MSEKVKAIIYLVVFIIILIGIAIFMNVRSSTQQEEFNIVYMNSTNSPIVEVNDTNFDKEVLESDKRVLIDFYATWCQPCKVLEPIIEEIAEKYKNIKVVEVDVDKSKNLIFKYRVHAMPTLIVIENGKEVNRSVGVISKDKVLELCGIE